MAISIHKLIVCMKEELNSFPSRYMIEKYLHYFVLKKLFSEALEIQRYCRKIRNIFKQ